MTDRGRETSNELTEVRTVLSRATTALANIRHHAVYRPGEVDPDSLDMEEALQHVVALLNPWRRTGR